MCCIPTLFELHFPAYISQVAFDKLTVDNANQQASAAAAATSAADQKASFGDQMAKATLDAFDQKAQFEGQMAEAKLAAGDMQYAFDRLTLKKTFLKAEYESLMAQAEYDAGGMKASGTAPSPLSNFSSGRFILLTHLPTDTPT